LAAVKPDDWDEDAPRQIPDEDAEKPEGWLDHEPADMPDPGRVPGAPTSTSAACLPMTCNSKSLICMIIQDVSTTSVGRDLRPCNLQLELNTRCQVMCGHLDRRASSAAHGLHVERMCARPCAVRPASIALPRRTRRAGTDEQPRRQEHAEVERARQGETPSMCSYACGCRGAHGRAPRARADSTQPEDWDTEEDGEWEAPSIPNPKCRGAPGCGPWTRPLKPNPAHKGKWSAPLIDNPEYKVCGTERLAPM